MIIIIIIIIIKPGSATPGTLRRAFSGGTERATSVSVPLLRLRSSEGKSTMSREIEPVRRSFCTAQKLHVYGRARLVPPEVPESRFLFAPGTGLRKGIRGLGAQSGVAVGSALPFRLPFNRSVPLTPSYFFQKPVSPLTHVKGSGMKLRYVYPRKRKTLPKQRTTVHRPRPRADARRSRSRLALCPAEPRAHFCFDSEESFLVRMESPCVVLWRPEALDCRVLYPSRGLELTYP